MHKILRHHFAMSNDDFPAHREEPKSNLSISSVPVSADAIIERVSQIPWGWIDKDIYAEDKLSDRVQNSQLAMYDLWDAGEHVGYAIIAQPTHLKAFNAAAGGKSVIEIENLALFPNEEGNGRGWQFFTLLMDKLYEDYEVVYWSQSATNYPTLKDYYVRKGMDYLGHDTVPNFNEDSREPQANRTKPSPSSRQFA